MLIQHYILTSNPEITAIASFIDQHNLHYEPHLNRIRFWIDAAGPLYLEFLSRFADHCPMIEDFSL